jgi:hypothetical protein
LPSWKRKPVDTSGILLLGAGLAKVAFVSKKIKKVYVKVA